VPVAWRSKYPCSLSVLRRKPGPRVSLPVRLLSWAPAFAGEPKITTLQACTPARLHAALSPKRKRGPALLPGPVSPDFCRGPGRIVGVVSAAPQSAPARACEPWVGRRGWPLSAHPEGELRLPASAARFVLPAGGRNSEALLDAIFSVRSLPDSPLGLRFASSPSVSAAVRSFVPGPEHLRAVSSNQGSAPFPALPSASSRTCVPPSAFVSSAACAPHSTSASPDACAPRSASGRSVPWRFPKLPQRVGGASVSQLPGLSHPRTVPECGFPKAPTPFPARVNL